MAKSTFTTYRNTSDVLRLYALETIEDDYSSIYEVMDEELGAAPDVANAVLLEADVADDELLRVIDGLTAPAEVRAAPVEQDIDLGELERLLAEEPAATAKDEPEVAAPVVPAAPVVAAVPFNDDKDDDDDIDAELERLLAEVERPVQPEQPAQPAPATETAQVDASVEMDLADLEAAVHRAEATEAMMAAAVVEDVVEGAVPTGDAAEVVAAKEGAASKPAKPGRTVTPRRHYSDKVERLKDRMGASLAEYTVLTTADALVDETDLKVVMERTLEIIRSMNSKEKNRASNFMEFLSGKKGRLNEVLERVLRLLEREGYLTTGNGGNVMKDLMARPYSPASARAMGSNTVNMYAALKVIVPDGKGKYVANPDSLLLAKARSLLVSPAAEAAAV